jgi:hypothetical protein
MSGIESRSSGSCRNFACVYPLQVNDSVPTHRRSRVHIGLSKCSHTMTALAACVLVGTALAGDSSPYFSSRYNLHTLEIQKKVEALYQDQEYERALFIYENELAPIGDKYAQYMVGFMHLTGMGVEEDAIAASAWYRLAAERSYPEFIAVRDQLLGSLSEPDLLRSDFQYRELRRQYSDLVILERLVREDMQLLEPVTGSRLSSSVPSVSVIDPRTGKVVPASQIRQRARERIEERLHLIDALIDDEFVETDVDKLDLRQLEQQIHDEIERIDDR